MSIASSRRAIASAVRARSRSARTRSAARWARAISAGDDAPASTRRCSRGVSLSSATICASKIWTLRCPASTLKNATAVSDRISSRTASRCQRALSTSAEPAAMRASRLPPSSNNWLIASVVSADRSPRKSPVPKASSSSKDISGFGIAPAWIRLPAAMPMSRSATASFGFAATARCNALVSVSARVDSADELTGAAKTIANANAHGTT